MMSDYDKNLLVYYYSRDIEHLKKTEVKYKDYASKIAKKCEAVKAQIDLLYDDLTEANILKENAYKLCKIVEKEQKLFESGVHTHRTFPWCPPPVDEDEDDIQDETDVDTKLEAMKEIDNWYHQIMKSILPTIDDVQKVYQKLVEYGTTIDNNTRVKLRSENQYYEKQIKDAQINQFRNFANTFDESKEIPDTMKEIFLKYEHDIERDHVQG